MKKYHAHYQPQVAGGFVCETYLENQWQSTFRHEGPLANLYDECRRRAVLEKAHLEELVLGLPAVPSECGD